MEPIRNILSIVDKLLNITDKLFTTLDDVFLKQDIFGEDERALTEGKFYKGEVVHHPFYGPGFVVEEAPEAFATGEEPFLCKIKVGTDHSYGPDEKILTIFPEEGLEHTNRVRKNTVSKEDLYPPSYPY